jgi:uncharacterized SAM-binding protein YcdF (DUF218 family)
MSREVVIVFGAAVRPDGRPSPAMERRVATALAWARGRTPIFLVTGGLVRHPPPEAVLMHEMLRAAGVSDAAIVVEADARTTLGSVRNCLPLLRSLEPKAVFACSDDFHLPRCRWLLRLAGVRAAGIPATPARRGLWPHLREFIALPVDTVCFYLGL